MWFLLDLVLPFETVSIGDLGEIYSVNNSNKLCQFVLVSKKKLYG